MNIAVLTGLALAAVFFYLVIPGLGAFFVRSRWRNFRKSLIAAAEYPEIKYANLHSRSGMAESGQYHFLGVLEAIQEDDVIWLRNEEVALSADMRGQKVFLLPSQTVADEEGDEPSFLSDETPQIVAWEKVRSLPEGIQVLLAGTLHITDRKGRFRCGKKRDLLVVFYDGDNASLLKRCVWHGRQRNEYWNHFTGISLAAGFLTGMILSYFFLSTPINRIPAILSIIMSVVPVIPVLPPGMVFFVLYRRLWRRGRFLRAQRDILKLPLRRFGGARGAEAPVPSEDDALVLAAGCEREAVRCETLSLALFAAGFAGNLYLVLRGLALLI
ncbi:MAG: hypothetical protein LBT68_02870 [Spirochaetales bacterium]|nr:hypothetical protein [Spirochaetales bacterium]